MSAAAYFMAAHGAPRGAPFQKKEMTMSTISSLSPPHDASAGGMARAVGYALRRWWLAYTAWRIERWAERCLHALSDRQLKDIGIVRSEIAYIVRHKDWRQ
jgi:uncharacterized protein YjiS (DUF1127 family)